MDTLKSLFNQFKDGLSERFSNPLVSSFLISWAVINYRVILTVFGQLHKDGNWLDKINYIDIVLWGGWDLFFYAIFYPLVSAFIWVYCLSGLLRKITLWERRRLNFLRKQTLRIDREKVITRAEDIALRKHIREEWVKISEESEKSSKVLQNLVTSNTKLQESLDQVNKEKDDINKKVIQLSNAKSNLETSLDIENKRVLNLSRLVNPEDLYFDARVGLDDLSNEFLEKLGIVEASKHAVLHESLIRKKINIEFPIVTETNLKEINTSTVIFYKNSVITEEIVILILSLHKHFYRKDSIRNSLPKYLSYNDLIRICNLKNIYLSTAINFLNNHEILSFDDYNKFINNEMHALVTNRLKIMERLFSSLGLAVEDLAYEALGVENKNDV